MASLLTTRDEVNQWFSEYFDAFIDISAGRIPAQKILLYWGVPLHTSSPKHTVWLRSSKEVVDVLNDMQDSLKKIGYTHTTALEKKITVYNENACRVDTIMSRRKGDGEEIDRAAVSFEIRQSDKTWIIVSTTALPTDASKLDEVW